VSDASDRDLMALFQAERAQDERFAPGFANVLAGRRVVSRRRVTVFRMAAALAAVVLLAVLVTRLTKPEPLFAITPGELRVPTDYLLDIAVSQRAGEIPRIGTVDWFPLTQSTDTRREQ
jgi:hypothetical protein